MATKLAEQKIKSLYQMLFEMATGNLAFRLPLQERKDGLDDLITALNQVASRMQATFLEHGYVSPRYSYQGTVQLIFMLDQEFTIRGCSVSVQSILGHAPESLIGQKTIEAVIAPSSIGYWNTITKELNQQAGFHAALHLVLLTKDRLLLPKFCTVARLSGSKDIIVTSLTTILEDLLYDLPRFKNSSKPKITQAETMQQLYDYIIHNLDQPLPSLKELARKFKINEFDLKDGFRTFFHTSIHKFYNDQRLRRAHVMIMQTAIPLKEIAYLNGFNSYLNFYKAFRKQFGYAPSELVRFSDDGK